MGAQIQGCHQSSPRHHREFHISNFIVLKKHRGYYPIINMKALNRFILEKHFKMDGFHMMKNLIRAHDWLEKFDLKDAYLLIPIHTHHHKYF